MKALVVRKGKSSVVLLLLLSSLAALLIYANWHNYRAATDNHHHHLAQIASQRSQGHKVILLWTSFFSSRDFYFGLGRQPFVNAGCAVTDCVIVTDRRLVNVSDATIVHLRDADPDDLPKRSWRRSGQRWVFFLLESPANVDMDLTPFNALFNWTMTYRLDSDIVTTYAKLVQSVTPAQNATLSSVKKRKLVAWLVSNCKTKGKREAYVRELRRHVRVDVYGACSGTPCDRECEQEIYRDYKFYLSFENSLCRDYATEKLYKVLEHRTVPVVYGAPNYSLLAPPNSFVDALSFASPKQLADHLLALDANQTAYEQLFEWQKEWRVVMGTAHAFCHLCQKLHSDNTSGVYEDIDRWWNYGGPNSKQAVCVDGPFQ